MTDRIEYRYAALEFRDDGAVITGVAMPYGTVARIMGAFDESVEPGAFGDVAGLDVILNRMHLRSEPIARTGKGGLTLTDSSTELRLKAEIPSYRGDLRDMVSRGILAGFSVEMHVKAEDWPSPDRRIVKAAKLTGIGLVDRAAYGKATAAIAKRALDGCTSTTSPWPLAL